MALRARNVPGAFGKRSPGAICGLDLLFILTLLRGFFSGSRVFLPPQNQNSKFQLHQDAGLTGNPAQADMASSLNKYICFHYYFETRYF